MKPIQVWTAQMAQHRLAAEHNLRFLDTTYMTGVTAGNGAFAPSKEMVLAYKAGDLPAGEYVDLYRERLALSQQNEPEKWKSLLADPAPLVVACYCAEGTFCHRHPFVDVLEEYAGDNRTLISRMGEFKKETYLPLIENPNHQIDLNLVDLMSPEIMIRQYLMASYAYYILHESPYVDHAFDRLCAKLAEAWDTFEHPLKKYTDKESLRAGTGYHIKAEDYPRGVQYTARMWCERVKSGEFIYDQRERLKIRKPE
jgi:hypothetical protein